jgi:hypothetical protein
MKTLSFAIFLFLSMLVMKTQAQVNSDRCLIAYYPFNGNALDSSFYGNDAILHNATLTNGHGGSPNSAYELTGNAGMNGSDIYIEVPNIVDSLTNLTISLWVKHNSYTYFQYGETYISFGTLPSMGDVATSIYFNKYYNEIRFVAMTDSGIYSCSTPYLSAWVGTFQHFAMVYDGVNGILKGYHNGSLVATLNGAAGNINAIGNYAGIGKHWWANGVGQSTRINGVFDEVKVYKCVLDSNQITELYTTALPELVHENTIAKVYPNPSSKDVNFRFSNLNNGEYILHIYNALGQEVRIIEGSSAHDFILKREDLPTGLYFYQLRSEKDFISSGEFVLQ